MLKKNSKNTTYLYLLYILFTIFIIILILFYYKSYEYYDSPSPSINGTFTLSNNTIFRNILDEEDDNQIYYQKGIGSPSHTGTINFTQPFSQNPFVFTQVNVTPDIEDNLYSVNVSNITQNSFDYYKNVISNNLVPAEEDQGEPMVAMKLSQDDNKSFNWIAVQ